ncbi:hypothetical protein [Sinomicrobium sp.]
MFARARQRLLPSDEGVPERSDGGEDFDSLNFWSSTKGLEHRDGLGFQTLRHTSGMPPPFV